MKKIGKKQVIDMFQMELLEKDLLLQRCCFNAMFCKSWSYVDEGTMIDTWASVGSCAQVGKNCHVSGGAGIGGVLEPLQAGPVIIEDNCFIGARSEIAEGVLLKKVQLFQWEFIFGASTKIVDRETGKIFMEKFLLTL